MVNATSKAPKVHKKLSKKAKIGIIFGVVILLAAIAAGVYFFFLRPQEANEEARENTAAATYEKLRLSGNSLSDFDLAFLQLEDSTNTENKIYSPLSIKYALAMLKDAANGESKAQIENLIGDYAPKAYLNSEHRSLANAFFVQTNFADSILPSYPTAIQQKYNAEIIIDDFNTAAPVNDWVSDKTLGLIDQLFDDATVNEALFILVNALGIDMNWNYQIQCETSETGVPCHFYNMRYSHEDYHEYIGYIMDAEYDTIDFNGQSGINAAEIGASFNNYNIVDELGKDTIRSTVKAAYEKWLAEDEYPNKFPQEVEWDVDKYLDQYMDELESNYHRSDISSDFYLNDTDAEKVFAKDLKTYDGSTLQYVGIMPKSGELSDYIKTFSAEHATELIEGLKTLKNESFKEGVVTKITGHIPFFEFDYNLDFMSDLNALGITDVFAENTADLTGMLPESSLGHAKIDILAHKANIEFTNEGIRAGAATAFGGMGSSGGGFDYLWDVPVETIDLTFDRPFLFLIRDKNSGEVWFTGAVHNLAEN